MDIEVKILRNDRPTPAGKLADAEIHFVSGELAGLKLVGFAVWERRGNSSRNRSVTFPARPFIVHGDKRNFALLRAIDDPAAMDRVRELVLQAFANHQEARAQAAS
jgi:hypothetical protein